MSNQEFGTIGIVGAGLVGSAWAVIFSLGGLSVRVFDGDAGIRGAGARAGAAQSRGNGSGRACRRHRGGAGAGDICDTLAGAVVGADYIQESVFETVEVKTAIAAEIGRAMQPDAICGSSSSGIPASAFTESAPNRNRFLIAHPVNPPHLVPVVELVPAPWTDADVVPAARALMERVGQSPVSVTREVRGFVLNRLQGALLNEAFALYEEGYATAADIDATISKGIGLRWAFMGPFETIDLNAPGGIDDYVRRFGGIYADLAQSRREPRPWSDDLVGKLTAERRAALPGGSTRRPA